MANGATETAERGAPEGTGTTGSGTRRNAPPRKKAQVLAIYVVVALIVIVAGILLYRYFASYESTDDAQIDGYIYPVSSRVPGYVVRVTVDDFAEASQTPDGTSLVTLLDEARDAFGIDGSEVGYAGAAGLHPDSSVPC